MSRNLRDDIEFHRDQIKKLLANSEVMRREACSSAPDFERLVALGGVLHSFYVGLEGVFLRISHELDGGRPLGDAWHQELLVSMTQRRMGRKPVIDSVLANRLREYLSFRHVFRTHYGFELAWGLMRPLVEELPSIASDIDHGLAAFAAGIESPPEDR